MVRVNRRPPTQIFARVKIFLIYVSLDQIPHSKIIIAMLLWALGKHKELKRGPGIIENKPTEPHADNLPYHN